MSADLAREFGLEKADFSDPEFHAHCASAALTLNPNSSAGNALQKAFDATGLDAGNPFHWKMLISMLASLHFTPPQRRGPKGRWQSAALLRLVRDIQQIRHDRPNLKTVSDISKPLKRRHPADYDFSPRHLSRLKKRADELLVTAVDRNVRLTRSICESRGLHWTSEDDAKAYQQAWTDVPSLFGLTGIELLDLKTRTNSGPTKRRRDKE
jgi:hypothetical protein